MVSTYLGITLHYMQTIYNGLSKKLQEPLASGYDKYPLLQENGSL